MPLYGNSLTLDAVMRDFAYAFADKKYPGVPELELNEITLDPFLIGDIPVIPIQVWHLRMPVYGFRFGDFTYITDANRIDDVEKKKIEGSKILVVNALRKDKHISHYNLDEAISLVQELEIPEAYFTHISHQLGKHEEIQKTLPQGVHLGWDGLELNS